MKRLLLLLLVLASILPAAAWRTEAPLIGAQVFIEPGQTPADIDRFFRILSENGMTAARIRLFGAHMKRTDGWDFSLYDEAFRAAERHGIGLFATLFPPTDELGDVGGFKFPRSKAHLREVEEYVTAAVTHFRDFPALRVWVLQNEPGSGATRVASSDLASEVRREWEARRPAPMPERTPRAGYLRADFSDEEFLTHYTTWYLHRLSDLVAHLDPAHGRHVNPHQLMRTLPDYDFGAYRSFLTSFGASFHLSWHFGLFRQEEYPAAVSLMADLLRAGAGERPFWITELQGGNVTASGEVPYCPTPAHVAQYLWTSVTAGAEGVIFWTLNQRAAALEAGEWGLLDFLGRPSGRLREAAAVAATLQRHAGLFADLKPARPRVTLLYNKASLRIQRRNALTLPSDEAGRDADACMKSLAAAYMALGAWGVTPAVEEMELFDWSDAAGRTVILPHMVALPSWCWPCVERFVRWGGRLIVTGLSGFYDEYMRCLFMNGFPLRECLGADLAEFRVAGDSFLLGGRLPAHLWRGTLVPCGADTLLADDGEPVAVRNRYGRGETVWVPSPIELGGFHRDMTPLTGFYGDLCREALDAAPAAFRTATPGVLMRTMEGRQGTLTLLVNKRSEEVVVPLRLAAGAVPELLYGEAAIDGRDITIGADRCAVVLWRR